MLHLILGRAGAGKTKHMFDEISRRAHEGETGLTLLVPEQYSHEAERELCRAVGDTLSLHAQALSFTGVCRRVEEELGRSAPVLDSGGRLLCMALALSGVGAHLRLYGGARRSPELQRQLLDALCELKAGGATPETLERAAGETDGALRLKLQDLALIMGGYDAAVGAGRADPADALTALLEKLPRSAFGRGTRLYIDGFTDFTAQETALLRALLGRCADMTVCLTVDTLRDGSEVFELQRRTARALLRQAEELGVEAEILTVGSAADDPLDCYAENLFTYSAGCADCGGRVELWRADTVSGECELAAAKCIALCREGRARWRDIAIAVRGFEDYRPELEAAFAYYGVPLFTARKADISQKPLPTLLQLCYELPAGGWETGDLSAYLRTGLTGLSPEECDLLENYCITWGCRAPQWLSKREWRMHPDGYGHKFDESALARLRTVNDLRARVAEPVLALWERADAAHTARQQAMALWDYMDGLQLAKRMAERSDELSAAGREQSAAEVARLWELTVSALEQCAEILGDTEQDAETFSRLFSLTLSQYDVGIIPVSMDMVTAGDFDRMRRRNIRHLIVLGAGDERLPAGGDASGVFSPEEKRALGELGIDIDARDAELWREFSLIYNCLSLPSDTLTLVTPAYGSDGAPARPSFVVSRAEKLFGLTIRTADPLAVKSAARGPALELAVGPPELGGAAARYFEARCAARLAHLRDASAMTRGTLSGESVRSLYGSELRFSASRADKFASCRFAYFLQFGLKAKPRKSAEFAPPEYGSFMHYILQNVAAEAAEKGGFSAVGDEALRAMTDRYIEKYIDEVLQGFADKSPRFIYLFRRLGESVRAVVTDMAAELRCGDFSPLDFELDLGRIPDAPAIPLPGGGSVRASGIADRVDGWVHEGRLYLRVVDYKTGKKSFSLSDVWYGLGMQMLLYLFTLQQCGESRYGREIAPAGVLYVPARDVLLSADSDLSDEEIAEKRRKSLTRSGLLLSDEQVLHAMEKGDTPTRLPVKWKGGVPGGDSLASAEQLGALGRRIETTLTAMACQLRGGSIAADPYYKGAQDNACLYCEYADACRFNDGEGGDQRRYLPRLPATKIWQYMKEGEPNG